jgi:hypothetical protein
MGDVGHVPTVTAITTTHFFAAAARAGVDTAAIAARLRLPVSPSYEDRIPMTRLLAAWEEVVRAVGDPAFPLRAAEYPERDARSLLTMLCAVQPTIARAAEIVNRYWPTVTDAYRLHVEKRGAGSFAIAIDPTGVPDRPGWRCHQEYEVADVVAIMSRLTGGAARPIRVTFRHRGARRRLRARPRPPPPASATSARRSSTRPPCSRCRSTARRSRSRTWSRNVSTP